MDGADCPNGRQLRHSQAVGEGAPYHAPSGTASRGGRVRLGVEEVQYEYTGGGIYRPPTHARHMFFNTR